MSDKLKYDEAPVDSLPIEPDQEITPELLELIFTCMSEKQQDTFLANLKNLLDEEDWQVLVTHLKAYDYAMMGDFREKASKVKEEMGLALYEQLRG